MLNRDASGYLPPRLARCARESRRATFIWVFAFGWIAVAGPVQAGNKVGSITYQDLASGGMAIVGVTSVIKGPTAERESRARMAEMFRTYFLKRRTDVPLMGADGVAEKLGRDVYDPILEHVQLTGELTTPSLTTIRAALQDSVRYAVVARLEKDEVKRNSSRVDPDDNPDTKNEEIVKTAKRKVEVKFRVYDLRAGSLAWSTKQSGEEMREVSGPADTRIFSSHTVAGWLESVVDDDEGPADPKIQGAAWNLPRIFDEFAKKLPQPKKKK